MRAARARRDRRREAPGGSRFLRGIAERLAWIPRPPRIPCLGEDRDNNLRSVEIDGASGKVVAAVTTTYSDRDEPSFEDDIVYLMRDGRGWLIAKASSTLYRAAGIADVPLAVLSPPD